MTESAIVVLLVEDDVDVRDTAALVLERHGCVVRTAGDGDEGLAAALASPPQIAVVDVAMPGMDGLRLAGHLHDLGIPVILLTARDLPSDIVVGLDAGADDYLTKPFDGAVLAARIRAVLRRPGRMTSSLDRVGPVEIDRAARTVTAYGSTVRLSDTEYRLLVLLLDYQGQVLTRAQIHDHVWPGTDDGSRVVDTTIQRLRKRLDADVIRTVRSTGYIIDRA